MVLDCAIYGEGPTVVLVQGTGGGRLQTWSDQIPLSKEYRLIRSGSASALMESCPISDDLDGDHYLTTSFRTWLPADT
jgi:hypothetical protein